MCFKLLCFILNQILTSLCVREREKGEDREPADRDHVLCCAAAGRFVPSGCPLDEVLDAEPCCRKPVPQNTKKGGQRSDARGAEGAGAVLQAQHRKAEVVGPSWPGRQGQISPAGIET